MGRVIVIKVFYYITWNEPESFYKEYIKPLYDHFGSENTEPTTSMSEADYIVAINYVEHNRLHMFDTYKTKMIFLHYEPWVTLSKQPIPFCDKNRMDRLTRRYFDIARNRSVVYPYVDIKDFHFVDPVYDLDNKTDKMSFVTTLYDIMPGHKIRLSFMDYLHKANYDYDLFGKNESFGNKRRFSEFKQYKGEIKNKYEIFSKYKYCLSVENVIEKNWFSEKFWDGILCECLPFYYGTEELENFIPKESFIRLPFPNFDKSLEIIKESMENNEWGKRLPAIKEAKRLFLEKYDLINTVEDIISRKI